MLNSTNKTDLLDEAVTPPAERVAKLIGRESRRYHILASTVKLIVFGSENEAIRVLRCSNI